MKFNRAAKASRTSVTIHCKVRNLTSVVSVGKSTLNTVISYSISTSSYNPSTHTHRQQVIRRTLRITYKHSSQHSNINQTQDQESHTSTKRRPSSCTPPSNNKPQQPTKPWPSSLSSPEINRASGRRSRTYFCDDCRRDVCEHHCYEVTCPAPSLVLGLVGYMGGNGSTSRRGSRRQRYRC